MPSTSINIGYRPPRIATLIRAGRLDDLGDAAVGNTHLWGGIRNPIVSVGDNVDVDEVVAELAWWQPDVVMAHGDPAPSITAVLDRMEHLRRPVLAGYGDFPYADVRLICRATRAGVVLLAAAQLDYHRHVPLMKQDNVPGRRARTMHDLALVTQAIHLGDAPVDVALGPDDYLI